MPASELDRLEPADGYGVLLLNDLNNSLRLILTFLMGGAAIHALVSLHEWVEKFTGKIARVGILETEIPSDIYEPAIFAIFCVTFVRFYWGGIRFFDLKHVEIPRLISSLSKLMDKLGQLELYKDMFKETINSSTNRDVTIDVFTVFYQATAFFLLAKTIKSPLIFVAIYMFLLIFNATYLWLTTDSARRHENSLRMFFPDEEDVQKLFPLKVRKIWILNNAWCGALMLATYLAILYLDTQGREFSFIIVDRAYFTFFIATSFLIIVANCCIDLFLARRLYWRSESGVTAVWDVCRKRCNDLKDESANRPAAS